MRSEFKLDGVEFHDSYILLTDVQNLNFNIPQERLNYVVYLFFEAPGSVP